MILGLISGDRMVDGMCSHLLSFSDHLVPPGSAVTLPYPQLAVDAPPQTLQKNSCCFLFVLVLVMKGNTPGAFSHLDNAMPPYQCSILRGDFA